MTGPEMALPSEDKRNFLWVGGLAGLKQNFITELSRCERIGIPDLINYLEHHTDFFTAPASANGHNNYPGGLVEHSILTLYHMRVLKDLIYPLSTSTYTDETILICALLHDICKANFYKVSTRMVKENGTWHPTNYYSIEDAFPVGHGEKSVILLQQFVRPLITDEVMAIRWHMGGFDDAARQYAGGLALNNALQKTPLVALLHMADLGATYLEIGE